MRHHLDFVAPVRLSYSVDARRSGTDGLGSRGSGWHHVLVIVVGLTGGIGAGKSTVSKLLGERGAAIVDADKIARELQDPGTPVLAAMVERFGGHIINDDGTLNRGAVAEIVFSDQQALKDLNGIVHPAMQAEIQRQIDENVDTDRLVVLDFPLLGENPRKGLAATIVVDIPHKLAVQRVVEQRGMDEVDARNRVNSQMDRENRLKIATHVVDNTGDLVDLVAAVDRLWDELIVLPATTAAHAGEPAEEPAGKIDRSGETVWIFGYGSLVGPESMARTIGRVAVHKVDFFRADLAGYGRRWNYGVMHFAGRWERADGVDIDDGTIVALGVVKSSDETVNGIVASVAGDELGNLDRRERNYDRVDVTDLITVLDDDGGTVDGVIYTYVPRRTSIEAYETARDNGTAGIRRTYWDQVDAAFAAFSAEQVERYRASTPAPDIPVVDLLETRER
ncbi:MAG: dephospho-CoA kinase [Ilumatobacter sp.]